MKMVRLSNLKCLYVGKVKGQYRMQECSLLQHTAFNSGQSFISIKHKMYTEATYTRIRTNKGRRKRETDTEASVFVPACRPSDCREESHLSLAVKTRPGCFPSCSCLIRRDLVNFWERPANGSFEHTPPPHPILLFLQFLPFFFFPVSLCFQAEVSSRVVRAWEGLSSSRTTPMTPESWWEDACQTAGPAGPLHSLCDSSCCCICSKITAWLSRHSLSLSSVSVRRSSSTATVWSTSGLC